ncbi:MAG TPA: acetylornithine deacetylase [Gammaproteobacteria bacterium]|nr:acetylornithine deacetylase [Gammaproteobacteria bacterium]
MISPPSLPEQLKQLIATPSISGTTPELDMSNRGVIDLLAGWLEDSGFEVKILAIPDHPGKFNLIATLGSGTGGLVLSGHSDTVPFDAGQWNTDPFKLKEADGRYYGLGISDMKSFFGFAIEAARSFDPRKFQHPLIILATADEETSMSGAKALTAQDLSQGRFAVIGEPTGLHPVRQHKGILMEAIKLRGQSGHSSDPRFGNNALEGMHEVIGALLKFRHELQQQHQNPAFGVPVPTLNLGHIHGGDNPNRICGECELHIDLRPLPGMALEPLRAALREQVLDIARARQLECEFEMLFAGINAMQTSATSPIVTAAEALTGHASETVAFGTEGPYLNHMGIDTLILGPGDIDQAHQPDEFLKLDRIEPTLILLKQLIQQFCLQ